MKFDTLKALALSTCLVASCSGIPKSSAAGSATNFAKDQISTSEPLTILSVCGGLSIIAGMILLVITSGKKGWFPSIGGCILVLLNYLVARYDDFLFYPLVICTSLISAAWTFKTIRTILKEKRSHDHRRTD